MLATLLLFACKKEDGKKVEFRALPFTSIVSDTLDIDSVRMNTFFLTRLLFSLLMIR